MSSRAASQAASASWDCSATRRRAWHGQTWSLAWRTLSGSWRIASSRSRIAALRWSGVMSLAVGIEQGAAAIEPGQSRSVPDGRRSPGRTPRRRRRAGPGAGDLAQRGVSLVLVRLEPDGRFQVGDRLVEPVRTGAAAGPGWSAGRNEDRRWASAVQGAAVIAPRRPRRRPPPRALPWAWLPFLPEDRGHASGTAPPGRDGSGCRRSGWSWPRSTALGCMLR